MNPSQKRLNVLLTGLWVLQMLYFMPLMPDPMATHFDGAGNPNGWSSPNVFFCLMAGVLVLLLLLFRALPVWIRRFPDALINLPHKEHWLAAERREGTMAFIGDRLALMGNATLLFFIATSQLVIEANRAEPHRLSPLMWGVLAAYLSFTLVWTIGFVRRFGKPAPGR